MCTEQFGSYDTIKVLRGNLYSQPSLVFWLSTAKPADQYTVCWLNQMSFNDNADDNSDCIVAGSFTKEVMETAATTTTTTITTKK